MLTLKKVKELVEAPVHTKRVPSPKALLEEGLAYIGAVATLARSFSDTVSGK